MRTRYISNRFDEASILASMAKVAFNSNPATTDIDLSVLSALRRSSAEWDLPIEQVSQKLSTYSDDQIAGLVSNVKGILHEMEFVRLENGDGDSVFATLFPDTNHKSVDIGLFDESSGESWEIQLKATDDMSAINSWLESNQDTEILVTQELAERIDLPDSGFSNEDLSIRVEDFVDRLTNLQSNAQSTLWDAFPQLAIVSAGIVVFELWRRYRKSELTSKQFQFLALAVLGQKAGKYAAIFAALSVPGLNVVVGAYLLGSLVLSASDSTANFRSFKPFASKSV